MATPKKRSTRKKGKKGRQARPKDDAARPDAAPPDQRSADEQAFVRGLIARGEAAPAKEDETLPPGATHRIVDERSGGVPEVRRDRFSAT